MGRFFSNIQIRNNQKQAQFKKSFCKVMQSKGYIECAEDDASLTYILAFSENNNWVTLCNADYESGGESVKKDVQFLAESLKTCCISTSVVDSDFAILEMYNGTSSLTGMVIVGDGDDYGFDGSECRGKRKHWEPYLKNGSTWEQLSDIWNKNFTFAEETLAKMAPLLDMNPQNIISDFDDLSSITDKNIVELHFKKKENKKALSLNIAFKQVFGEALEPLGFKKIKSKYPYFVRVAHGGEIIHVITCRSEGVGNYGRREFSILGGIATVYRHSIDLTKSPSYNINWLNGISYIYKRSNPTNYNKEFGDIYNFSYKPDDDVSALPDDYMSMLDAIKYSLKLTEEFIMPIFDKVINLNECIEYFDKVGPFMHIFYVDKKDFDNDNLNNYCNEGLLLTKTNRCNYFRSKKEMFLARKEESPNKEDILCTWSKLILLLDKTFNGPELHTKVHKELERRKAINTDVLRSYGLEIS